MQATKASHSLQQREQTNRHTDGRSTSDPDAKTLPSQQVGRQQAGKEAMRAQSHTMSFKSRQRPNGQNYQSSVFANKQTAESFALQNNVIVSVLPLTPVR